MSLAHTSALKPGGSFIFAIGSLSAAVGSGNAGTGAIFIAVSVFGRPLAQNGSSAGGCCAWAQQSALPRQRSAAAIFSKAFIVLVSFLVDVEEARVTCAPPGLRCPSGRRRYQRIGCSRMGSGGAPCATIVRSSALPESSARAASRAARDRCARAPAAGRVADREMLDDVQQVAACRARWCCRSP